MEVVAISRTAIEGSLVVITAFVLFGGSVWLLLAAIFGVRMGYLVAATGMFAFMIILSALWTFGAPGTPPFLGPKGDLPAWIPVAAGTELRSEDFPAIQKYPAEPWREPGAALSAEVESATVPIQEFLAERAAAELRKAGIEGEVAPEDFEVTGLRFTESDGTLLGVARAFATTGGPEVTVVAFKSKGDEPLPSYLFLIGSIIGFGAHLPFLDRAERKRKEILTGGEQAPWRGPA